MAIRNAEVAEGPVKNVTSVTTDIGNVTTTVTEKAENPAFGPEIADLEAIFGSFQRAETLLVEIVERLGRIEAKMAVSGSSQTNAERQKAYRERKKQKEGSDG